jgi:uncharacterized protein (DUF427 family)
MNSQPRTHNTAPTQFVEAGGIPQLTKQTSMSRPVLEPTADHPITIVPTVGRVVVKIAGHVVADTSAALTLEEGGYDPVQYIPAGDIDQSVLRPSETTSYCPYKGDAGYFSVDIAGHAPLEDVAWFYEQPYASVTQIANHVAFYADRAEVHTVDRLDT